MSALVEKIMRVTAEDGNRIALIGDSVNYSYQQLLDDSVVVAQSLIEHDVDTLALIADNSPQWIVIDLACQIANICFIPLPAYFSKSQIEHSLKQAGVDTLLLGTGLPVPESVAGLKFPEFFTDDLQLQTIQFAFNAYRLPRSNGVVKPRQTSKITFTSGSTGQPRGVCLGIAHQHRVAQSLVDMIAIKQPRHLCVLPLATLLENIAGVYSPLLSGGCIHVPSLASLGFSGSSSIEAKRLLQCIDQVQPETLILIPQLLDLLTASVMQGWKAPRSLKMIAVGGSRVAASAVDQARKLGFPVYEGYGLSECASVVSLNTPEHDKPGSAGQLLPHLKITLVNEEIQLSGNTFLGYLDEKSSWDLHSVVTGDLGFVDDQGFVHLQGRRKNLLISSFGRNINPEWLESEILAHPLIQQCIVVGDARAYCSALIYADRQNISCAEIQQWLDKVNLSLPDYARINAWHWLQQPMSADNQLLTANLRPRREAIAAHFSNIIEQMYNETQEYTRMSFFQRLQSETASQREQFFSAPIIQQCLSGQVTLEDYVAFLTEAYHHVKHTTPLLMAVGSRIPADKEWLREAVAEYIEEELGHQEWILNDIAACGYDKEKVRHSQPSIATELMVSYAYDLVQRVNPLGFFGMVHVLEGSSVTTADRAAEYIQTALGLPDKAFSYLRSHGALDQQHVKFFEELMNRIDDPQDQQCIIHSAAVFYQLYGNMFRSLTDQQSLNRAA